MLGPTIIYVTVQKTASKLAEFLQSQGLPARAYHAGMQAGERKQVQAWFMDKENNDGTALTTLP